MSLVSDNLSHSKAHNMLPSVVWTGNLGSEELRLAGFFSFYGLNAINYIERTSRNVNVE